MAGKLFCPGLDLVDLCRLDRPAMERFLGRFNWTFIPCVASLIEAFLMKGWCNTYNQQKATEIATSIRAMRRAGPTS